MKQWLKQKIIMKILPVLCSLICLCFACTGFSQTVPLLPVQQFEGAIKNAGIQLLDVRTIKEFNDGHILNALQADWTNQEQFTERVKALDKSKPVYTYCLSGARSGAAAQWLQNNGFTAYNLKGGIAAWKGVSKPLEGAKVVDQISLKQFMSQLPKNKTVLVDVGASWCPPCKKMNPVIDSLAAVNAGAFQLQKIDGAEQSKLSTDLKVEGFPTFIIYKNGKEVWRKQGITDALEIVSHL